MGLRRVDTAVGRRRPRTSRLIAFALAAIVAVVTVGCAEPPGTEGGGAGGGQRIPMTFTGAGNLSWLNVFVAHDEGMFAEHGIESNVKLFDVGFLGTEAVMAGEAHTAGSVELPLLGVLAQGADLVVPAVVVKTNDQRIVVDRSIRTPQDLAGKRIGLIKGSNFEYSFQRYLEQFKVPSDSVEFVNVDAAEQVAVMARGDIDGFLNVEPVITRASGALGDKIHVLKPDLGSVVPTRILLEMKRSYVEQNPQAVEKTLAALRDAATFIKENPDRAAEIGAKWTKIPAKDVARFLKEANFDYRVHYDQEAFDAMAKVADWMDKQGRFKSGKPDLNKVLYLDPLRKVDPDAVEFNQQ